MEKNLENVLENHAKDASEHPQMKARIEQHLHETRRHVRQVDECLQLMGDKPSAMKNLVGNVLGTVQGVSSGVFRDAIVKNVLSDYASEAFEIACYRSLIVAAEELGQTRIAETCRQILAEEEAHAAWLNEQIDDVTRLMLHQEAHA